MSEEGGAMTWQETLNHMIRWAILYFTTEEHLSLKITCFGTNR